MVLIGGGCNCIAKLAAAAARQVEESDRARQIAAALGIDGRQQRVDRQIAPRGNFAEGLPEGRFERDPGGVPGDADRVLDQGCLARHVGTMPSPGDFSRAWRVAAGCPECVSETAEPTRRWPPVCRRTTW